MWTMDKSQLAANGFGNFTYIEGDMLEMAKRFGVFIRVFKIFFVARDGKWFYGHENVNPTSYYVVDDEPLVGELRAVVRGYIHKCLESRLLALQTSVAEAGDDLQSWETVERLDVAVKPWSFAKLRATGSIVEIVSKPDCEIGPDRKVYVRMIPGISASACWVLTSDIVVYPKWAFKRARYFGVAGPGEFPVDVCQRIGRCSWQCQDDRWLIANLSDAGDHSGLWESYGWSVVFKGSIKDLTQV